MSDHPDLFEDVFDALNSPEPPIDPDDPGVFDGSYQCRRCGTIHQVRTFAGAARPPKQITTDCPGCGGHRPSDAIAPDGEPVLHRWYVPFEDLDREPGYLELIAPSKRDARTQAETDYPDRTIEAIGPLAYRVTDHGDGL